MVFIVPWAWAARRIKDWTRLECKIDSSVECRYQGTTALSISKIGIVYVHKRREI